MNDGDPVFVHVGLGKVSVLEKSPEMLLEKVSSSEKVFTVGDHDGDLDTDGVSLNLLAGEWLRRTEAVKVPVGDGERLGVRTEMVVVREPDALADFSFDRVAETLRRGSVPE